MEKKLSDLISSRPTLFGPAETKKVLNEYEDLVDRAAKLCYGPQNKRRYIIMHKRLEKAFDGVKFEAVMVWLRRAVHMAEKETKIPKGMKINAELKRYRFERAMEYEPGA